MGVQVSQCLRQPRKCFCQMPVAVSSSLAANGEDGSCESQWLLVRKSRIVRERNRNLRECDELASERSRALELEPWLTTSRRERR